MNCVEKGNSVVKLSPVAKILSIGRIDDSENIKLCFNVTYSLISTKSILDLLYMLNGFHAVEHIVRMSVGHANLDSGKIIGELTRLGIVHEYQFDAGNKYVQAKDMLIKYTVHFPKISNVNMMIAVLLQKLRVQSVFYENGTISQNDTSENIYYKDDDVGKDIRSFMQEELGADTVRFTNSDFASAELYEDANIIVNSDLGDWINSENLIVINTWNYKNAQFEDFSLFNGKIKISDNLKPLVGSYILAIRSVDDMLYSIGGVVS